MTKALIIAALITTSAAAQTAKVEALTPAETAKVLSLAKQIADLQQQLDDFRTSLKRAHLQLGEKDEGESCRIYPNIKIKPGWACGDFEFSDDYRYIVPAPVPHFTAPSTTFPGFVIPAATLDHN